MNIEAAIVNRRTIRHFRNIPVEMDLLRKLVSLSRLYASGGNIQPIRYAAVNDESTLNSIFDTLKWAAYLPDFTISREQRPTAYVVLLCDEQSKKTRQFDVGAAATTLMLAAEGEGLASCCLASFNAAALTQILSLPQGLVPALVIALGYADQKSRAVDMVGDDVKYYEEESGCLCVPKRRLEDVLIG